MHDQKSIRLSSDGSHTLFSDTFGVTYHSFHGAITESTVVFIDAGLHYFAHRAKKNISVFEMGFGTGLNALLAAIWADKENIEVAYHTVESNPISTELAEKLNYPQHLGHHELFKSLHSAHWDLEIELSPKFTFKKYHCRLEDLPFAQKYDVIFYDAFSPGEQPSLWETEILKTMFDILLPGGILVTYCAKGQFKRTLRGLGFEVQSLAGPPGKREITRAIKVNEHF
ncbi:MAG: tRNA (5-methylaminomethyl-2-thiouridine)(34)-methyltransferase MnmD [Saprospiraceae bacterium]